MKLGPGEPAAGPWRVELVDVFARSLAEAAGTPVGRPRVISVDGRGGGGKTALAERLCRAMRPAAVVHSDDVAWEHSRFGWDDLMIAGVLQPLHAGNPVHYRPPAWDRNGRKGHIDVSADASTVIVEGVGVARRELAPLVDVVVWVQSDFAEAKRRGMRRDMAQLDRDEDEALRRWDEWEAEEVPFLLADQPWRRAHFIVGAASSLPHDAETEVVVSPPLLYGEEQAGEVERGQV
jgi:uridine kinase